MGLYTYLNGAINQRWYFADVKATDRPAKGEREADFCWCADTNELFIWNGSVWVSILASAASLVSGRDVVAGLATSQVVTHNLNDVNARITFATTWHTTIDITAQGANTATVEFGSEAPSGGGTLIWIAVAS